MQTQDLGGEFGLILFFKKGATSVSNHTLFKGFVYWCEGVLMVPVGVVGLLGNVLAIIVLSSE